MTHLLARRGGHAGDVGDDRLGDLGLDEGRRLLLGVAADLADHDDRLGVGVGLETAQHVDERRPRNRIATDTDAGRLADPSSRQFVHGLIGEGPGTGDDTDRAGKGDLVGHDPDVGLAG